MFTKMTKRPLTPTGVSAVVTELYALPTESLLIEADAVATDFRLWLIEHFELTPKQETFIMHGLQAAFIDFVQARLPFVFLNRLPISYTVLGRLPEDDDDWGKIIEGIDGTSQTSSRQGSVSGASGTFQFIGKYYKK